MENMTRNNQETRQNGICPANCPRDAQMLMGVYSGKCGSELTAVMQYSYQAMVLKNCYPEVSKILLEIAENEMHHLHELGEAIVDSCGDPTFCDNGTMWCADAISFNKNAVCMIEQDILAEEKAAAAYRCLAKKVCNPTIRELLEHIACQEDQHVEMLCKALEMVRKTNCERGTNALSGSCPLINCGKFCPCSGRLPNCCEIANRGGCGCNEETPVARGRGKDNGCGCETTTRRGSDSVCGCNEAAPVARGRGRDNGCGCETTARGRARDNGCGCETPARETCGGDCECSAEMQALENQFNCLMAEVKQVQEMIRRGSDCPCNSTNSYRGMGNINKLD